MALQGAEATGVYEEIGQADVYEETWTPCFAPFVFFLPCFYKYGVRITREELIFGYGCRGPFGCTACRFRLTEIDGSSITTGNASCKDNFLQFGGWGIRMRCQGGRTLWAYNASNGPYIEFRTLAGGSVYHFVSRDVEAVAAMMRRYAA
eukprot:TRINITY_DN16330_c0_g1_i1.p1 TRINITY_DN16330_c0_g1~~TRINITY_DN16330_c0_g1_i1.p1  ORF type:complete len:149 (-),score=10.73 TRINITY_DN16330_c0_g1_i1:96-542(-)